MRIVTVCRAWPTLRPGGMLFVAETRAEELVRQGHEVHVLTTSSSGSSGSDGLIPRLAIHYLDCPTQVYSAKFAEECAAWCKRLAPDVIHLDSFDRDRLWWSERPGSPKIVAVTMHGNQVGADLTDWNLRRETGRSKNSAINYAGWMKEREGLSHADRVLAVSLNEQWQLRDVLGLPQTRLVYNPIPQYFFDRPRTLVDPDAPFLCVGVSGHGERGFNVAAKAAETLGRKLVIAKNHSRVSMPQVYDDCCAVLLPTMYAQGYDLAVAEANARGRMVFASPTGSYLRESERNLGLRIVRDCSVQAFVDVAKPQAPPDANGKYPPESVLRHQPEYHVDCWMEALGC